MAEARTLNHNNVVITIPDPDKHSATISYQNTEIKHHDNDPSYEMFIANVEQKADRLVHFHRRVADAQDRLLEAEQKLDSFLAENEGGKVE